MPDFGFNIQKARSENLDAGAKRKYLELIQKVPSFKRCFQCGCCSATCSARQFTDFNIRRVHTMLRRGNTEGLASELRKCMLCGKCTLVCPRGVNLRQMIVTMRGILKSEEMKK